MKKTVLLFLALILSLQFTIPQSANAESESFFPSLNKVFGITIPLIRTYISVKPNNTYINKDGETIEEYEGFSAEDYQQAGKYFQKSGFTLYSSKYESPTIKLMLQKEGQSVALDYNPATLSLKVKYPRYYTEETSLPNSLEDDTCLFPNIEDIAGVVLPSLSTILKKEPDAIQKTSGKIVSETYYSFSESDYKKVSEYLLSQNCVVTDYSKNGDDLLINLQKANFTLKYNPVNKNAVVEYESNAVVEQIFHSTPVPTATPSPTLSDDEYNTYAAVFVIALKGMMKNPNSVEIHHIKVMEYKGKQYIVIDFSAMNGFGGYNRESYSFKFQYGQITLDEASVFDEYENNPSAFKLIHYINVDEVMKIVNRL